MEALLLVKIPMLNLKSHTANIAIITSLAWNAVRDTLNKAGK